jgi:2-polyprenyl-3-methyl-5-hydroxy-6-metoxy-1,4-benzoquinol methylase
MGMFSEGGVTYRADIDLRATNNPFVELLKMVGTGKRVLEVGPGSGHVTHQLTQQGCRVTCVEKDKTMAEMAQSFCDHMIVGDIESDTIERQFSTEQFDVVTFGDVLEHLRDPSEVLIKVKPLIGRTGYVVASIPNVAHRSLRLSLLFGEFDYGDIGLLDRTHLRFFTIRTIEKLMNESGYKIVDMVRIRDASLMDSLLRRTASWSQRALLEIVKVLFRSLVRGEALTYQFVIKAVPISTISAS